MEKPLTKHSEKSYNSQYDVSRLTAPYTPVAATFQRKLELVRPVNQGIGFGQTFQRLDIVQCDPRAIDIDTVWPERIESTRETLRRHGEQ